MSTTAVTLLLCFVLAAAEPRPFEGVVLDQKGAPIERAELIYSDHQPSFETGRDGRFSRPIAYSRLLVRKAGYISAFASRSENGPTIVRLEALPNGGRLPRCPSRNVGFSIRFAQLPKMKVSGEGRDIDFAARSYWFGKEPQAEITHGSGPMWGAGFAMQNEIEAVGFEERVYLYPDYRSNIYDYRYRKADGSYVRSVGWFGETAAYSTADLATARKLDAILDGVCLVRSYE